MENCIFCKIAKGELPCFKIYEDENFFAFLDINPLNKGHTLVIPKKHYRWVFDVDNEGEYFSVVKKIANNTKKVLETDYIVSFILGEEVSHAHIHLVPRFKGDGHGAGIDFKNVKKLSKKKMEDLAKKLSI